MIRRSKPLALALLAALAASLVASATRAGDEPRDIRFTILYTTDIHAHYLAKENAKGEKHGGFAALAAKVKEIKDASKDPVFVFDSGDVATGHPVSDLDYQGITGGALYELMNQVGYDAWCIGNHDFDHGRENVSKIVAFLKFPTLNANLVCEGDPPLKFEHWKIIEKGGVKLGVFGLMSEGFDKVTSRDKVKGIKATSTADAARECIAALTSKCDVIVALSHCGSDFDIKMVDQVKGIDIVLSGHNHRSLRPAFHGNTIVAEGDIWARELGRMDIKWNKAKYERPHFDGKLQQLPEAAPSAEMKKVLDFVDEAVGKRLKEKLGAIDEHWKRANEAESNIGDFFADGVKSFANADCAFLNSGGIRANLAGPDVTVGDVAEIFPFEEAIVTFELTGADLKKACEKNATAAINKEYGILQVAGVRYEFKRDGRKAVVTKVTVNGEALDPEKKYKCATTGFIALDQHEKYLGPDVNLLNTEKLATPLAKVAEDWVREQGKKGPIKASLDGRMSEAK